MKLFEMMLVESFPLAKKEFTLQTGDSSRVNEVVSSFQRYLKQPGFVEDEYSDINYWRKTGFEALEKFVKHLSTREEVNKRIKLQAADYMTITETPTYRMVIPVTHSSSCDLGKRSTWCTAHPGQPMFANYFYRNGNVLVYIISKNNFQDNFALRFSGKTLDIIEVRDLTQKMESIEVEHALYNAHGVTVDKVRDVIKDSIGSVSTKRSENEKTDLSNQLLTFLDIRDYSLISDELDHYVVHQIKELTPTSRDEEKELLVSYLKYIRASLKRDASDLKLRMFDKAISRDEDLSAEYLIQIRRNYPNLPVAIVDAALKSVLMDVENMGSLINTVKGIVDLENYPAYWRYMLIGGRMGNVRNEKMELVMTTSPEITDGIRLMMKLIDSDDRSGPLTATDLENSEIWKNYRKRIIKNASPSLALNYARQAGVPVPELEPTILKNPNSAVVYYDLYYRGTVWEEAEPIFYKTIESAVQYHTRAGKPTDPDLVKYIDHDMLYKHIEDWKETSISDYCSVVTGTRLPTEIENVLFTAFIEKYTSSSDIHCELFKYRQAMYGDEVFNNFMNMISQNIGKFKNSAQNIDSLLIIYGPDIENIDLSKEKIVYQLFNGWKMGWGGFVEDAIVSLMTFRSGYPNLSRTVATLAALHGADLSEIDDDTAWDIFSDLAKRNGIVRHYNNDEVSKIAHGILRYDRTARILPRILKSHRLFLVDDMLYDEMPDVKHRLGYALGAYRIMGDDRFIASAMLDFSEDLESVTEGDVGNMTALFQQMRYYVRALSSWSLIPTFVETCMEDLREILEDLSFSEDDMVDQKTRKAAIDALLESLGLLTKDNP